MDRILNRTSKEYASDPSFVTAQGEAILSSLREFQITVTIPLTPPGPSRMHFEQPQISGQPDVSTRSEIIQNLQHHRQAMEFLYCVADTRVSVSTH